MLKKATTEGKQTNRTIEFCPFLKEKTWQLPMRKINTNKDLKQIKHTKNTIYSFIYFIYLTNGMTMSPWHYPQGAYCRDQYPAYQFSCYLEVIISSLCRFLPSLKFQLNDDAPQNCSFPAANILNTKSLFSGYLWSYVLGKRRHFTCNAILVHKTWLVRWSYDSDKCVLITYTP